MATTRLMPLHTGKGRTVGQEMCIRDSGNLAILEVVL